MSGRPVLTMRYVHARKIGYGRFAIDLRTGLERRGIQIVDGILGDPAPSLEEVEHGSTSQVAWFGVPSHALGWLEGQQNHCFTMWEATVLPEAMREYLHLFDTIIVPSRQNQELFGRYHPNVQYCPLGIDTSQWFYTERKPAHPYFNFMVAGSGARKGYDVAFEAFQFAFPDWEKLNPTPHLIHKSPRGVVEVAPWLTTVSTHLSDEDELALYGSIHCYVGPSRGEGFGLQPLQAMAQGIPTILTNAHGHEAFAHLGWPVRAELVKAGTFMQGDAGDWWEPDPYQVADHMRAVYDNYDLALDKAKESAETVRLAYSEDAVAARFLAIIRKEQMTPYEGSGEWFVPTEHKKLYYVKTNRAVNAEIGGNKLILEKGEETWLPADAKRVLFDVGSLDPACIESEIHKVTGEWVDTALTEGQRGQYERQRDADKVCLHCGQILGSGINLADKMFAELEAERASQC